MTDETNGASVQPDATSSPPQSADRSIPQPDYARMRLDERKASESSTLRMLLAILAALTVIFIVGLSVMIAFEFESEGIVAVMSPALGIIGTVAAGVFGLKEGAKEATSANEAAQAATRETGNVRAEAESAKASKRRVTAEVKRIAEASLNKGTQKDRNSRTRTLSEDDLNTLVAAVSEES